MKHTWRGICMPNFTPVRLPDCCRTLAYPTTRLLAGPSPSWLPACCWTLVFSDVRAIVCRETVACHDYPPVADTLACLATRLLSEPSPAWVPAILPNPGAGKNSLQWLPLCLAWFGCCSLCGNTSRWGYYSLSPPLYVHCYGSTRNSHVTN